MHVLRSLRAALAGSFVACSTFGEAPVDTPPAGDAGNAADAAAPTGDSATGAPDGGSGGGGPLPPCGGPVFCDGFEGTSGLPAPWDSAHSEGGAQLRLAPGVGIAGSVALQVEAPGNGGALQQGFLLHESGAQPASYALRMAFAAQVVVDSGSLSGPRALVEAGGSGDRLDVVVVFAKGTVSLADYAPGCTTCGTPPTTPITIDAGWHQYVLQIFVTAANPAARTYGSLSLSIDGIEQLKAPLWLPLASARRLAYDFGLSSAKATEKGSLLFDDAYFASQ